MRGLVRRCELEDLVFKSVNLTIYTSADVTRKAALLNTRLPNVRTIKQPRNKENLTVLPGRLGDPLIDRFYEGSGVCHSR